jgi:hypothetical protein
MDTAERYKLNEAKQQARLGDFLQTADLSTLQNEIALARTMLESASNAGNTVLARDLLGVVSALVKTHRQQREKDGLLLDKAAVVELGNEIAVILADEFADVVDDFPERMDRTAERIAGAISSSRSKE